MATTGLPPDTAADVARVTEALAMITPRWNVRIMLALSGPPLRYSQIADKMPWLQNGQLHPKLRALCDAGLVQRTEHTSRHVTYGHTDRGAALLPVLPLVVTWAEEHLEKTDRPLPAIEQIEDSLTLLTRRHATAILWVLKSAKRSAAGPWPASSCPVATGPTSTRRCASSWPTAWSTPTAPGSHTDCPRRERAWRPSSGPCPPGPPDSPSRRPPSTRSGDARTP